MQIDSDRSGLSFESLEDRRLLAQTPQILSDLKFGLTGTEAEESISPFLKVNDLLVARTNDGGIDWRGRLEVFRTTDSQQWDIEIPNQQPESMVELNGELFLLFERHRITHEWAHKGVGQQLWKTDGETAVLVKAISELGTTALSSTNDNDVVSFVFQDHLYFPADAEVSETGNQLETIPGDFGLWRTDGTTEGTVPVTQLIPDLVDIAWAMEVNDRMLLSVERTDGTQMWTFDGTSEGTFPVFDSPVSEPVVLHDKLYFVADSNLGQELHVSDGTVAGTQVFADLAPGADSSNPRSLLQYDGEVWFIAETELGFQRWATDGVSAPTVRISNPVNVPASLSPETEVLLATDDWILFAEVSQESRTPPMDESGLVPIDWASRFVVELWISDGTQSEPEFLAQIEDESIEGADDGIPPDVFAQQFGDELVIRMLTSREQGTQMRYTAHAIDLPMAYVGEPKTATIDSDFPEFNSLAEALINKPLKPGDLSLDGQVNFADFVAFADNFGMQDAEWKDGDFNGDGIVSFSDFLLLSANFGV